MLYVECMHAESHALGMIIMSVYLLGNARGRLYTPNVFGNGRQSHLILSFIMYS